MTAAIRADNIGKQYRVGVRRRSLREIVNATAHRMFYGSNAPHDHAEESRVEPGNDCFWALNQVSFDVRKGELLGIIGRNGAGKSTLLKILSRIVAPTRGRVELRGRVASLLEVGTGFHPELTGRENTYLNSAILGMTKSELRRRFDEIVSFAGVEQFIDTPVKRYSSGMYMRLAFAVAAHLESEILIVDEVLAVGDAEFQDRCLGKMSAISREGRTVILVSHNLAAIRQLTRSCIFLEKGRLAFHGPTDEALGQYIRRGTVTAHGEIFDVENVERPWEGLSQIIRFSQLSFPAGCQHGFVTNGSLEFQAVLKKRDPFEAIPPVRFAMTIYRKDHTAVGSCFSGRLTPCCVGGEVRVRLRVSDVPLTTGEFYCSLSVGDTTSHGWELFDSVSEVLPFRISAGASSNYESWQHEWGAVRFSDIAAVDLLNEAAETRTFGAARTDSNPELQLQ